MLLSKQMFFCMAIAITGQFASYATAVKMSLATALKQRLVSIDAIGQGGAQGNCLSLSLCNRTSTAYDLTIDNALIFQPVDTNYQNLVAVGDVQLALQPKSQAYVVLQTFCGKSYARCPTKGLKYQFLKKGDNTMVEVARFIKAHSLYNYVGQRAIWALTNNHRLGNIYNESMPDISRQLAELISKRTGRKVEGYATMHRVSNRPGEATYDPTILKYKVVFDWTLHHPRNLHVKVYRADGTLLQEVNNTEGSGDAVQAVVELDPQTMPQGLYSVVLHDDDNSVLKKQEVFIE